jgi:hypothetical protein
VGPPILLAFLQFRRRFGPPVLRWIFRVFLFGRKDHSVRWMAQRYLSDGSFFAKSIGIGPFVYWTFGTFRPLLNPYFLSEFLEAFLPFFCLFKKCICLIFNPNEINTLKPRMVKCSSPTHLYTGPCFGFLIPHISGFFGFHFRAFPPRWISSRPS